MNSGNSAGTFGSLIIFVIIAYFVPTAVALLRRHKDAPAIAAVNIFFGWSVIGWFIAFIWSLSDPRGRGNQTVVVNTHQHVGPTYDAFPEPHTNPSRIPAAVVGVMPPSPRQSSLDAEDRDTAFWDKIIDKRDVDSLEEYLVRYPNGRFSKLARDRLSRAGFEQSASTEEYIPTPKYLGGPSAGALSCSKCGAAWDGNSRFCTECGASQAA